MVPTWVSEASKRVQESPRKPQDCQDAQRLLTNLPDGPEVARRRPKTAPRQPKRASRWHKKAPSSTKRGITERTKNSEIPLSAPGALGGPRRAPRGPQRLPRGRRRPQEGENIPEEASNGPQEASKLLRRCLRKTHHEIQTNTSEACGSQPRRGGGWAEGQ